MKKVVNKFQISTMLQLWNFLVTVPKRTTSHVGKMEFINYKDCLDNKFKEQRKRCFHKTRPSQSVCTINWKKIVYLFLMIKGKKYMPLKRSRWGLFITVNENNTNFENENHIKPPKKISRTKLIYNTLLTPETWICYTWRFVVDRTSKAIDVF